MTSIYLNNLNIRKFELYFLQDFKKQRQKVMNENI